MVIFLLLADGIAVNNPGPKTAFIYTLGLIENDHGYTFLDKERRVMSSAKDLAQQ